MDPHCVISPFQRLALTPHPLVQHQQLNKATTYALSLLHPLKTSRYHTRWAMKHRALILRDQKILSSYSGSLTAFYQEVSPSSSTHDLTLSASPNSSSLTVENTLNSIRSLIYVEDYLLSELTAELCDLDGHQEHSHFYTQLSREVLKQADLISKKIIQESKLNVWEDSTIEGIVYGIRLIRCYEYYLKDMRAKSLDRWNRA